MWSRSSEKIFTALLITISVSAGAGHCRRVGAANFNLEITTAGSRIGAGKAAERQTSSVFHLGFFIAGSFLRSQLEDRLKTENHKKFKTEAMLKACFACLISGRVFLLHYVFSISQGLFLLSLLC